MTAMTDIQPATRRPPARLAIDIVPVETKRQMGVFLRLPRRLYAGMPGFVPPLDLERRGLMHPRAAAFYQYGRARFFLAMRDGRAVGRISAQVDPVANEHWGERIGLFGALDSINDAGVVEALLDTACDWLRGEGMVRARGPYTLSAGGESGLLVSGQQERAMILSPWHPTYLGGLVEAAGWVKAKDLLAYDLAIGPEAEAAHPVPRMQLGQGNLVVRGLRPGRLAEDAAILRTLYNDAWADNWGSVPITEVEIAAMIKELKPLLHPDHYVVVERDGVPLAMALIVPNLFDVVGDLGGAPSPAGWVRLLWRMWRRRFPSARVILLGVTASLRGTMLGSIMPSLIIAELMKRGRTLNHQRVELGWILEDNVRMRRLIERLAPEPYKVFRLFEKTL